MNAKLKEFLDFIVKPESRLDVDNYVASRKITDNNVSLVCGYLNGAGYISGIAFDKLIKVRFNYFEHSCGFYVNIDGVELEKPVSKFALDYFFTNGVLLGHPDQPVTLRPTSEMHWYLWEAVCVDLGTLRHLKIASDELYSEADTISTKTKMTGLFCDHLRARACKVELEVEKHRAVLDKFYEGEQKKEFEAD
jgi:hypothetical protein